MRLVFLIRILALATMLLLTATCKPVQAQNLITNGSFGSGNTSFVSDYGYVNNDPRNVGNGKYTIAPIFYYFDGNRTVRDHSGTGKMMLVDGATTLIDGTTPGFDIGNRRVWSQEVQVVPGRNYKFVMFATKMTDPRPAGIRIKINNFTVGLSGVVVNLPPGEWHEIVANWNSGTATSAKIEIIDLTTSSNGNDFAIDDISFRATSGGDLDPFYMRIDQTESPHELRYIRNRRWYNTAPMLEGTWCGEAFYGREILKLPICNFVGPTDDYTGWKFIDPTVGGPISKYKDPQSIHPSGKLPKDPLDRLNRAFINSGSRYYPKSTYFITHKVDFRHSYPNGVDLLRSLTTKPIEKIIPSILPPPWEQLGDLALQGVNYSLPGVILDRETNAFGAFRLLWQEDGYPFESVYPQLTGSLYGNPIRGGWELPYFNTIVKADGSPIPSTPFENGSRLGLYFIDDLRDFGQFGDHRLRFDMPINFTEQLTGYKWDSSGDYPVPVSDGHLEYYPKRAFVIVNRSAPGGTNTSSDTTPVDIYRLGNRWSLNSVEFESRRLTQTGKIPVTNSLVPHNASMSYRSYELNQRLIGNTPYAMMYLSRGSEPRGSTREDYIGALTFGFNALGQLFDGGFLHPPFPNYSPQLPEMELWKNTSMSTESVQITVVYEMEWIGKLGITSPRNTSAYIPSDLEPSDRYDIKMNKDDSTVWNVIP